ncbi:MAG: ABC transporter substrate-binding protein [Actinobacteria bacterium]|nr:ABC transporter substrate-binding protein [Actinomycetota bacterium]MBV9663451.1 ABC transporter substrate-binding protein [Actinomycetota bacterium]
MNAAVARIARWRVHLIAVVVLLILVDVAALGGADATSVVRATRAEKAAQAASQQATSSGIPSEALQAGTVAGSASGPAAAGGATGARLPGVASAPGRHVTYDDGASDTEVKIGGSTFTSGPAATYGEQIAVGFAAGVNYVNDHGGINGRRLSVKIYDDGADPAKQLANIKRLVEVDHVFALSMSYAPISGEYAYKVGIPVFLEGQFDEDFFHPWYFGIGGPQSTSAMSMAWYGAKKLGIKSVSVFYLDAGANNYSKAFADKVASYWKAYGVDVKAEVPFTPDQTSCSQGISEASGDKVDYVDFQIDAGHVIQCMVEAQIQGYKPPKLWGGYLIGVPVIHQALGDYSIGTYAFDAFADEYKNPDYIAEVKKVSNKTDTYSSVTMGFFLSALLAADGMRQLGDQFTRAHLKDVLNTFTDWRPGLTNSDNQPKWTFSPQCHIGIRGGYVIQIHKQPDGSLRWDQITPQGVGSPIPPGQSVPTFFQGCRGYFVPGETAAPF